MSYITRRVLSTLIPPKVASPKAIGSAQDALRMQRVVSFYEKLPRGPAPEIKAKGPLGWYQAKYFGKNASVTRTLNRRYSNFWLADVVAALIHLFFLLCGVGYAQNYYFHLRHHKNNAH